MVNKSNLKLTMELLEAHLDIALTLLGQVPIFDGDHLVINNATLKCIDTDSPINLINQNYFKLFDEEINKGNNS